MKKKRKIYTTDFKREAVSLVVDQGYSFAEAGRSLGINSNQLSRWKRELEADQDHAFPGHGKLTPDQQRIRDLEKENHKLRMEKEILKKATAFFVKESS